MASRKAEVLEVLRAHARAKFAFRNAESGDLYTCECGRRFNDAPRHLADALEEAGLTYE